MLSKSEIKLSKALSLVLRHKPEAIGLKLDSYGWANVNELILCMKRSGKNITFDTNVWLCDEVPPEYIQKL